ncbi:MAG: calcium-binding protein [Sedimentitalea sp.]
MRTIFTYLPGDRPGGFDPSVGFGFAGNIGYWYTDFVAESASFTDHWLTEIDGGVRLNIGEQARFSDETDRTDHYIDFLGDTLALGTGDQISGAIDQVLMGVANTQFAGDYFQIDAPRFSADALTAKLGDFIAAPDDNITFYNFLTKGIQSLIGHTALDNHGGFQDERLLTQVDLGAGNDVFIWQGGNLRTLRIELGDGDDLLRLFTDADTSVNLFTGAANIGSAQATVSGATRIVSGAGDDQLTGSARAEVFQSEAGNDVVKGAGGADRLFGGDGRDVLLGGKGRDVLEGGRDNDTLRGGTGRDLALYDRFDRPGQSLTVDLGQGLAMGSEIGQDQLFSIEDVVGSSYDDRLLGSAIGNTIDGQSGNDLLSGRGGRDFLDGGRGDDVLVGGRGLDVFIFNDDGFDTVRDFTSGQDDIDLSSHSFATSFQAVLDAAQDGADGVLITLNTNSSVLLSGVSEASLAADDFIYFV